MTPVLATWIAGYMAKREGMLRSLLLHPDIQVRRIFARLSTDICRGLMGMFEAEN